MNSIYNWDAAEYEKHSSQQQLWTQDVIRSQKLAGDERILDIGCGDGKVTAELAALVPKGCVRSGSTCLKAWLRLRTAGPTRPLPQSAVSLG